MNLTTECTICLETLQPRISRDANGLLQDKRPISSQQCHHTPYCVDCYHAKLANEGKLGKKWFSCPICYLPKAFHRDNFWVDHTLCILLASTKGDGANKIPPGLSPDRWTSGAVPSRRTPRVEEAEVVAEPPLPATPILDRKSRRRRVPDRLNAEFLKLPARPSKRRKRKQAPAAKLPSLPNPQRAPRPHHLSEEKTEEKFSSSSSSSSSVASDSSASIDSSSSSSESGGDNYDTSATLRQGPTAAAAATSKSHASSRVASAVHDNVLVVPPAAAAAKPSESELLELRKDRFILSFLNAYLETSDPVLHRRIQTIVQKCAERERQPQTGLEISAKTPTIDARSERIVFRQAVGDALWEQGERHWERYLGREGEGKTTRAGAAAPQERLSVANQQQHNPQQRQQPGAATRPCRSTPRIVEAVVAPEPLLVVPTTVRDRSRQRTRVPDRFLGRESLPKETKNVGGKAPARTSPRLKRGGGGTPAPSPLPASGLQSDQCSPRASKAQPVQHSPASPPVQKSFPRKRQRRDSDSSASIDSGCRRESVNDYNHRANRRTTRSQSRTTFATTTTITSSNERKGKNDACQASSSQRGATSTTTTTSNVNREEKGTTVATVCDEVTARQRAEGAARQSLVLAQRFRQQQPLLRQAQQRATALLRTRTKEDIGKQHALLAQQFNHHKQLQQQQLAQQSAEQASSQPPPQKQQQQRAQEQLSQSEQPCAESWMHESI